MYFCIVYTLALVTFAFVVFAFSISFILMIFVFVAHAYCFQVNDIRSFRFCVAIFDHRAVQRTDLVVIAFRLLASTIG